jgi:ATP-dependent 26S proteasome regulatory subunit
VFWSIMFLNNNVIKKFFFHCNELKFFFYLLGTGKTLVASALSVECSNSERKVSFISRKGSDCLSKWVGESEKKLQKIFQMVSTT